MNDVKEFQRGWKVLLAAFLGLAVNLATLPYYATGIWVRPWQEEFGWTRAEIGGMTSIAVVVMMLCSPFAGRLIDRFGLRYVTSISLLLFATSYWMVSVVVTSLSGLYWITVVYAVLGIASTPLAFTRAINAFFSKNRGLALGIGLSSTGITAFLIQRFLTPYVADHGWRAGFDVLFWVIVLCVPIIFLWIRDAPELSPEAEAKDAVQPGMTFSQSLRTPTYWKLAAIFLLISTAILGLVPNYVPLLLDSGMTPAQAGGIAGLMGISVMVGRLIIGWALDHIFAPYVVVVVFVAVAGFCLLLGIGGIGYAVITAIALGFAVGAEVDLIGYFTARYFGMAHYGSIYGSQYSIFILGAGISPIFTGYIWDVTGNYDIALFIAAGLLIPTAIIALTLPRFED
ncbi:MFS transporter [Alphaproteobacteria bacterium]|nr:MFS transporter [Alphaproteobacteria bacterium]MDC0131281.1 MFS transporter [Alphaproteobacteria bacterium]